MKDAEWIADLLRHGLFIPGYMPDREQREFREVIRYRRSLIEARAREADRLQKILERAMRGLMTRPSASTPTPQELLRDALSWALCVHNPGALNYPERNYLR